MLSKKLETAMNDQINAEFWSAYLYLSMSAYCSNVGLSGAANWFKIQFQEEQAHAEKFMNYMISRGNKVTLKPIEKVKTSWKSLLEAFKDTLEHEKKVTAMIHNLYALAEKEKDYAAKIMLNWYVNEQVEEEEHAQGMIDALTMIGDGYGLYQFDKELAARVFTPIAEEE
ncbi:MAG: ferritin [Bacteroidales bacterium]|nr:ferritin [Bacteroidales bacterium]